MKQIIIIILILFQTPALFAQKGKSDIHKGNQLYQEQKYQDAEASYRRSLKKDQSVEGNFNLGDAFYKQKKFDDAAKQFAKIAAEAKSKAVKAKAYHNLGNSLLQSKKLKESIEAYKKALLNAPKDDQTRYNLAYAQQLLKKQQQQKNQNNKKDQNKNNQNKKDQDKKNQDKKDKNKHDQNKDQQNKDQDKQQQQNKGDQQKNQQPQQDKLSKEDAQRMLDALNNEEQQTQDKLKNKKLKGAKAHIEKDW